MIKGMLRVCKKHAPRVAFLFVCAFRAHFINYLDKNSICQIQWTEVLFILFGCVIVVHLSSSLKSFNMANSDLRWA